MAAEETVVTEPPLEVEEEGMEKAEEVAAGWAAVSLHTLQQFQLVNR